MQLMALPPPPPPPAFCTMQHSPAAACAASTFSAVKTYARSAHGLANAAPFHYSGGPDTKKKQKRKIGHLQVVHASDAKKKPPSSSSSSSSWPWSIGEKELHTIQRVARLQMAIANRSPRALLELIGDECQYYYRINFAQINPIILVKNVVGALYSFVVKNNITFLIKPTKDYGVDLGVRWVLVSGEMNLPLIFGLNMYTNHFYKGTIFIRNAGGISSSLQHLGTLAQKMVEKLLLMVDKLLPEGIPEDTRDVCKHGLLSLLFMSAFFLLLKNTFA